MKTLIVYGFLMAFFMGCSAQKPPVFVTQKNDNTLLWEVSGNGLRQPSFLFGTFHLLCKQDIHFSAQLQKAVNYAHEIYMELDMDDPSTMLGGMLYMNMKGDTTLADLYTSQQYTRLKTYFSDTLHLPLTMLQRAKPYFLVALLYPRMMNCPAPAGVEEELVQLAKKDKKEIQGLETIAFQASVFDSIPYRWQAKELLNNIDSFATNKKEFQTMLGYYENQNMDSIKTVLGKSEFGSNQYDDLLLNNRNKKWVKKLGPIMKRESVFVAVGAGHLVGDQGLIHLLQKQGYTLRPLENKRQ